MKEFVRPQVRRSEVSSDKEAGSERAPEPAPSPRALQVGSAHDPLEADADRAAAAVMTLLEQGPSDAAPSEATPPSAAGAAGPVRIARKAGRPAPEVDGGPLGDQLSDQIRSTAGHGAALDPTLRRRIEPALGTDLGSVRVHADSSLAPRLGAEAFTAGNDIHFAPGRYSPGSSSGMHLLSHELAHVAQNRSGGAAPIARKVIERAGAPASDVPGDVRAERGSDVVRAKFSVGKTFKRAKKMAKTLFGKAEAQPDEETGDEAYDSLSHEQKMTNQRKFRGSGPGENPDWTNTKLWGTEPSRFVVTLAVAQEDTAWMQNINDLKSTALKMLTRNPKKMLSNLPDQQQAVIRQTLLSQGKLDNKTEDEISDLVEEFSAGLHDVGHTWVRLSTHVDGQMKELYSYGMWPQKLYSPGHDDTVGGYAGFVSAGAGEVKHPDLSHEGDTTKAYKDYEVSANSFDKALDLAIARYNSPPPYVLTGYNCTAFAREVLLAAGKNYPGAGILPGFAYTPGDLYWAIMEEWAKGKKSAYTSESNPEAMQAMGARNKAFSEAGQEDVDTDYNEMIYQQTGPTGKRRQATLKAGRTILWGNTPAHPNQVLKLDKDMEVTVVEDQKCRDDFETIPLEFDSFYWYVSQNSFAAATAAKDPIQRGLDAIDLYGTFRAPKPDDKPHSTIDKDDIGQLFPTNTVDGEWTEVYNRHGDYFWVSTALWVSARSGSQPTTDVDDDTSTDSGGSTTSGVIASFTWPLAGLQLWTVDGKQIPGTYRAQGKSIGATGRTVQAGSDLMCEFVIEDTVSWMPEAWWQMGLDTAYPTSAPTIQGTDNSDDTVSDNDFVYLDLDDLDDDVDELPDTAPDQPSTDQLDQWMSSATDTLRELEGFDLTTLSSMLDYGYQGLSTAIMVKLIEGNGGRERAAQLAACLDCDVDDLIATFRM